jgi:sulfopyruvate decarboxylase TPP-binding subunit
METIHKKTSRKAQVPMGRWCQEDLKKMKLIKWTEQVQDRLKWKDSVEKAKTLPAL